MILCPPICLLSPRMMTQAMTRPTQYPSEEDIHDSAAEVWALISLSEYDEVRMPQAVYELHCRLNEDEFLYLAVWERLEAPLRRQFKDWLRVYLQCDEYRGWKWK